MSHNLEVSSCPACSLPLLMVRMAERLHFDCLHCAKYGYINTDVASVHFERDSLPQFRWQEWGRK